jgi:hypothetical protein
MWNTVTIQYNPLIEEEWDEHFKVSKIMPKVASEKLFWGPLTKTLEPQSTLKFHYSGLAALIVNTNFTEVVCLMPATSGTIETASRCSSV